MIGGLGAILGWKFSHYSGISTKDNKITEWPGGLGPLPQNTDIERWALEYAADLKAAPLKNDFANEFKKAATLEIKVTVLAEYLGLNPPS